MHSRNENAAVIRRHGGARKTIRGGLSQDSNTVRRLPPYGRHVSEILQQPAAMAKFSGCSCERASVWILTGPQAWNTAASRPRHLCVVLPDGSSPHNFSWGFLRGHEPIIIEGVASSDADLRRMIASALMRDGVTRVLAGSLLMVNKP